ncbi:hypothetical protein IHQ56_02680 [Methylobacillus flagellatus]|uniref:hypothetical protein n=1 Tax=Methylobacillus flagellatus TaxID=405 RepID=UPI00285416DE|nr:hypothetical protein [Methylobacillus flagellatus]MDR5170715.1 hypothetical protein [Methylobacillus flagellatus]
MKRTHEEFELPPTKPSNMVERLREEKPAVMEAIDEMQALFGSVTLVGFDTTDCHWRSRLGKEQDAMLEINASQYIRLGEVSAEAQVDREKGKK